MSKPTLLFLAALLTACGQSEAPKAPAHQPEVPSVEELASNPVAEASNKRFFGDGKVPHTPPETPSKF
ncbi:entry exclusion lipoprotein TrbK [Comamonas sp.]|uniref:entry exclusion lipoprotein TrbK n=1 Tax=Comamonas sp. TaxID=34028 RepID=UPI0028A14E45|nr:entry exclusion lipoprotein TrbK [Comamonas sp.]